MSKPPDLPIVIKSNSLTREKIAFLLPRHDQRELTDTALL